MKKKKNEKEYSDMQHINEKSVKKSSNREIIIMTYIFIGLIFMVLANFTYYLIIDSDEVINNPYNIRQDLLAEQILRGKILGSKGEILAETVIEKDEKETRKYPYKDLFCHIVGNYTKNRSGVELAENFSLLTSAENPLVKVYNELSAEKTEGDNVRTTLDVNLQQVAYDALGNHKGAVVVMEPNTGKILAMVSKPDYDPNKIAKNWDALIADQNHESALLNRATQGLYPPGSTFKVLTALEYIRENKNFMNYSYHCDGNDIFRNVKIKCFGNERHGKIDLEESFAESCNTSFANIGVGLNMKSFRSLCDKFLFNSELPFDIAYKKSSFVLDESSDLSLIPQTVLGQGETLISPFHNALIISTIANGGILMNPYVVDQIESYNGTTIKKYMPSTYGTVISADEAKEVTKLMEAVVKYGTADALADLNVNAAGKTGSAEYNSDKSTHAWFVGFAPAKNPEIVVSVIVEEAGTGSKYAVPIAKKILKAYFTK